MFNLSHILYRRKESSKRQVVPNVCPHNCLGVDWVYDKITPVDVITITFDGVSDSYYDGYNLHEQLIASSLNNSEIKVFLRRKSHRSTASRTR